MLFCIKCEIYGQSVDCMKSVFQILFLYLLQKKGEKQKSENRSLISKTNICDCEAVFQYCTHKNFDGHGSGKPLQGLELYP